ncbi:omega-6 fatty acid desaturase (delta-12 desaturase) [Sporothrix schenckii 1099-18]|uniref:Omega-6 fatty acid desaturase (Delta-12 desaturase) n=1 Tax=Sporothrix schenckii 1099-18 TaxID=1397361 RepID=A0A0F2MH68_SPOSC|nr:omega-6 fatty acid desaturase (delta-12 desaturase) [Sporothrix schenckii 1099-18]KJR89033.1 omega-6 fatty acid desaturase (delta-12 desaturase) [Sporothrix schenckii 1099-18]
MSVVSSSVSSRQPSRRGSPARAPVTNEKAFMATNAPEAFPDIKTIRDAIPAHCFESSTAHSMAYVVRDYAMAFVLGWAGLTYIPNLESTLLRTAAWIAYGYAQGLVLTGIWILGHEAGHGAFSPHGLVNDIVGWLLHSSLMVPYFSWKFSHHRHHRFTGHMEKDMVFVPRTTPTSEMKPGIATLWFDPELVEDTPLVQMLQLIAHQLAGWQMYLLFNLSAGDDSKQRDDAPWYRLSHFEPTSAVFRPSEALFIALSDIGLLLMAGMLYIGSTYVGWSTVVFMYVVPYMWVHHWLIAITYLHHNHPDVHHYDAESWTYVKGALATVDRDFGWVGRHLFHGIIDTHVVHHLFPRIPFYKQEEATAAIRPLLGNLLHRETRSFVGQLWSTWKTCKYVVPDPSVPGAMKWAE